jgi:hypothetical protein
MTKDELKAQKTMLITYLLNKVAAGDWHAVCDAGMDLREIDAVLTHIKEIENVR